MVSWLWLKLQIRVSGLLVTHAAWQDAAGTTGALPAVKMLTKMMIRHDKEVLSSLVLRRLVELEWHTTEQTTCKHTTEN